MRVLVTGGAGFIGSNLALELENQGYEVDVIDNLFSGTLKNLRAFRGNIMQRDLRDDLSGLPPYSIIFHQAAITDPRHPDDTETLESNTEGFRNILDIAERDSARVVYASSAGIYGNGPTPMVETQSTEVVTAYGRSKLAMEFLAQERPHLQLVGLRYFNVFGPREAHKGRPASMVYHLWKCMREGQRPRLFKWGKQFRDFIYVKDVVRANLLSLQAPSGVYNVGTGTGTTFLELVEALNAALGTRLEAEFIEMPYEKATYQHGTQADIDRSASELSFKSQWGFEPAVADYVKWLEKEMG